MRGVEATTRQILIASRQVCSTVQGIHLSESKHTHKPQYKLQFTIQTTKQVLVLPRSVVINDTTEHKTAEHNIHKPLLHASEQGYICNDCFTAGAGKPPTATEAKRHTQFYF